MSQTLLQQYIGRQPALWRAMLAGREALTGPFARLFAAERPERVVCVGSGSSHYASLMARQVLERGAGVPVQCAVPSDMERPGLPDGVRTLYVAVSQSGLSANTCQMVQRLRREGCPVAVLTERAGSPVGRAGSLTVPLPVDEERIGAKTKGVTVTVLTLMLLGLAASEDEPWKERMYGALERLCAQAEENLRRAAAWSRERTAAILPFRHLYTVAAPDGMGAAREGALKLLETNYLPVSAYALDEYVHGIQNALDESACLLGLLPPEGPERERMLRLADFARSVGAAFYLIAPGGGPEGALCLETAGEPALRQLEYLPALQTLAAALSAARGIDAEERRYPDFYTLMGSKLPEQS